MDQGDYSLHTRTYASLSMARETSKQSRLHRLCEDSYLLSIQQDIPSEDRLIKVGKEAHKQ